VTHLAGPLHVYRSMEALDSWLLLDWPMAAKKLTIVLKVQNKAYKG